MLGAEKINGQTDIIALTMEAASTSETLVNFYQTIRRNNPEDSYLETDINIDNLVIALFYYVSNTEVIFRLNIV
jgi:hypothetical protein